MCKYKNSLWLTALVLAHGCALEVEGEGVSHAGQALEQPKLLALGDSIAFGYNPFAASFDKDKDFVGYPEILEDSFSVKNAGCPGEASCSFLSSAAPDFGCKGYRGAYPLHVNYGNKETQLEYALSRLEDPEDVPDVITLNLAGNDIFLLQAACGGDPVCFQLGFEDMVTTLTGNIYAILGNLRGAGYTGEIVFLTLYTTATYATNPGAVFAVQAINDAAASILPLFGARLADGFSALGAGVVSPCEQGWLIPSPAPGGGCDVHPSTAGHELLADAILNAL